jgi:hypothetical protein
LAAVDLEFREQGVTCAIIVPGAGLANPTLARERLAPFTPGIAATDH